MWSVALFLPAYIINPGVPELPPGADMVHPGFDAFPELTILGYGALWYGLIFTAMGVGIFAGSAAVLANWIIIRGVFNFKAGRKKPVENLKWFAITHLLLLGLALFAFRTNWDMFYNEGGVGVRGWLVGPAAYVWFASLVIMTIANYCAYRWRQTAASAPSVPPPLPSQ
jgi:hypothetical protein